MRHDLDAILTQPVAVPITGGPTDGQRVLFSVWETRVQDYEVFVKETGHELLMADFPQELTHPVTKVSKDDARSFCEWLTKRERKAGRIGGAERYRLPSDHEWSCAVEIGGRESPEKLPNEKDKKIADVYPWTGNWPPPAGAGNFPGEELQPALTARKYVGGGYGVISGYRDAYVETSPVGSFQANNLGLQDLSGNVWEWCEDWYDSQLKDGMLRGGSWLDPARSAFLSSNRYHGPPGVHNKNNGFRCVLDTAAQDVSSSPTSPVSPSLNAATKDAPFVNTLGMKFVPVPITGPARSASPSDAGGGPTEGQRVLFSVWETRVQDYEVFVKETKRQWLRPNFGQEASHPVVNMSWNDAQAFCRWLTEREQKAGRIAAAERYRLPHDHEWSCAVGIGDREDPMKTPSQKNNQIMDLFPWGTIWPPPPGTGNYADESAKISMNKSAGDYFAGYNDGHIWTAPVGSFPANRFGLFDLSGNAHELSEDEWQPGQNYRTGRGGSFDMAQRTLLQSSNRSNDPPDKRIWNRGFRCVLESSATSVSPSPSLSVSTSSSATKDAPFINTLGMKFVPVPGTKVLFCMHATRVKDYAVFAREVPALSSHWKAMPPGEAWTSLQDNYPVAGVSWRDAQAFCAWLSKKEGKHFRLPTDREWSFAAGIGAQEEAFGNALPKNLSGGLPDSYPWGNGWPPPKGVGNFADVNCQTKRPEFKIIPGYDDGYVNRAPVMSFIPNPFGLYDMGGNVRQWCEDWHDSTQTGRVVRGSAWSDARPNILLSSYRDHWPTDIENDFIGLRCVVEMGGGAEKQSTSQSSPSSSPARSDSGPVTKDAPFTNTLGMKLVPVPGTKVLFCIHEARYQDYAAYAAETPDIDNTWKDQSARGFVSTENREQHPVMKVGWEDAQKFCAWLSRKEGRTYRLPTDEEWSIAVGLGPEEKQRPQGATPAMLSLKENSLFPWGGVFPPKTGDKAGNYSDASRKARAPDVNTKYLEDYDDGFPTTAPVMSFKPNELGLYDMGGNVWEWCVDWYDATQKERMLRGGSWEDPGREVLLSSNRRRTRPDHRPPSFGFRVVLVPESAPAPKSQASASAPAPAATKEQPFSNTLGMKFVPVPIGGGPTAGKRVLFSIWDTRVQDYLAFARANKVNGEWQAQQKDGVPVGRELDHPVVGVNWEDAQAFCQWLTAKETAEGKLPQGMKYRLPSDEEWSWAVGLPSEPGATPAEKRGKNGADFPWGIGFLQTGKEGNYSDEALHAKFLNLKKGWFVGYNDGHATTSPVGSFPANAYGLYDMGGNVWQWCEDWFDKDQKERVLRGGSWGCGGRLDLLSSSRKNCEPGIRGFDNGFRCVLTAAVDTAAPSPSLPVSTSAATPANKDAPFINTLGMQFVPVPGTKTLFCIHETRRQDYAAYAAVVSGLDRSWMSQQDNGVACGDKDNHPVVGVSWKDAQAFCKWLSGKEGVIYRLPTDEEWSWAAGIGQEEQRTQGTTPAMLGQLLKTEFSWGTAWPPPEGAGNYCDASRKAAAPGEVRSIEGYDDGFPTTAPVMSYKPNNLGLYDMGGNVWEYCEDWYDNEKYERVVRGGSWFDGARGDLHLSRRGRRDPGARFNDRGFRLVLVPPPSAVVPPMPTTTNPSAVTKEAPFTNTLGMKFVPVPGTKTLMCIHETRRGDYAAYAKESPDVDPLWMNPTKDGIPVANKDDQPVSNVSWTDAQAFCAWLRRKEGRTYRLPTDREWSSAVGIGDLEREGATPKDLNSGIKDVHPWGSVWPPGQGAGNYADTLAAGKFSSLPTITAYADGHAGLAPVMSYPPNKLGIHDLGGNVWEWCEDWYDATQTDRLRRGGSYIDSMRDVLLSSKRMHTTPHERQSSEGFRCVIELPAP
jgi:formylglycine-generating enzyme required for sulfatase activity